MAGKRLIDANALIEELTNTAIRMPFDKGKMFALIENAPTIDAVEVVRCKDCKYGGDRESVFWKGRIVCNRRKNVEYVLPDDFCSYGERRANG